MRFEIPELRHKDQPDLWRVGFDNTPVRKPIVILTSNSDKSLPEPFLRRCVYYHIPEHTSTELSTIAITRLRQKPDNIDGYLAHFYDLITQLHEKKPATAELLQWLWYCQRKHVDLECLQTVATEKCKAPLEMRRKVWASYSVLIKSQHDWEELGARYFDKETNKA
jgi:MoxR-like ATPase